MSSKDRIDEGSLELLLDTICNTFGGVLFISLLVVILLNMTSRKVSVSSPPTEDAQAEMARSQSELAETQYQLSAWRTRVEQQEKTEKAVANPELEEMLKQLHSARAERANLDSDCTSHLDQVGTLQTDVNKIAAQLARQAEAMNQARRALAAADERLKREVASRTRELETPVESETKKLEVPFLLRNGRLCACLKKDGAGNLVPNEAECVLAKDADGRSRIEPKPGAGLVVDPTGDADGRIAGRLKQFDSTSHYLAIFVWPDSFDQFATVRDVAINHGFQYRLVPFPEGEKIFTGAPAGPAKVIGGGR